MRFLLTLAIAVCMSAGGSTAEAFWCWGGGWGWGSYYAPYWGGYSSYRPYYYGGYRTAGYGCSSCGCSPCSCSPCGCSPCGVGCATGCGTGCGVSCSGGACSGGACGAVSSDGVPGPVDDPGFRDGVDSRDDDPGSTRRWRDRQDDNSDSRDNSRDDAFPSRDSDFPGTDSIDNSSRFNRDETSPPENDSLRDEFEADRDRFRGNFDNPTDSDSGNGLDDFDALDESRLKPDPTEPVDDATDSPSDALDLNSDDVRLRLNQPESSSEARLRRGLLSEMQSRTTVSDSASRFRLAGQTTRRDEQQRRARWSGRRSKQRTLQWIGAPPTDGRVRL